MKKQLEFKKIGGWGGKRKGAGRPNRSGKVSHGARPDVDRRKPLHITQKLRKGVCSLRTRALLKEFKASAKVARQFGLYVNHFSLLSNHIHIIAEARDKQSLARGMKSMAGRFAKKVRKAGGHAMKNGVFLGRFHLHVLHSPREMKNALEYVLLNNAKHLKVIAHLDVFSSARSFNDWDVLLKKRVEPLLREQLKRLRNNVGPLDMLPFESWLGRVGWQRAVV